MKEEHHLRTWGTFLSRLKALRKTTKAHLLFRGHADSRWQLTTTLERRGYHLMDVADYYRMLGRVKPQVESITGQRFDVPNYPEIKELLASYDDFSLALSGGRFPGYSFFIHLRHHGFPSPLLDWTRSPYIAAFFAFASASSAPKRSIYVWAPARMRSSGTNHPELKRLGPYVPTHRRHVHQQSDYTVCPTYNTAEKKWRFTPHEDAMGLKPDPFQDRLWKFTLPLTSRIEVLRQLDEMNVNAYSLFGSEESLMDTVSLRELDLRDPPDET